MFGSDFLPHSFILYHLDIQYRFELSNEVMLHIFFELANSCNALLLEKATVKNHHAEVVLPLDLRLCVPASLRELLVLERVLVVCDFLVSDLFSESVSRLCARGALLAPLVCISVRVVVVFLDLGVLGVDVVLKNDSLELKDDVIEG